jgi:precorrin isomerase
LCLISLSDLMTPWEVIERRIGAAVEGDFVTAVYNPRSTGRWWQLHRLRELFLAGRAGNTPVGWVRQAGRPDQSVHLTTLAEFDPEEVDMFTVVLIGNSQSYIANGRFVTPRGYFRSEADNSAGVGVGREIMTESFATIERELSGAVGSDGGDTRADMEPGRRWALLHAIHTTADFDMVRLLWTSPGAVETLHELCASGRVKTIVTDVTMAAAGIRRGALLRLGIEVKCYLHDERVAEMAAAKNITRTQAGIRLAVGEHPEGLYVFGNAPTALMELCALMRRGEARPAGVIAAPVGFVHVEESKHMLRALAAGNSCRGGGVPCLIVEGRKGGSNLAATLANAVLTFNDAAADGPGRDL